MVYIFKPKEKYIRYADLTNLDTYQEFHRQLKVARKEGKTVEEFYDGYADWKIIKEEDVFKKSF